MLVALAVAELPELVLPVLENPVLQSERSFLEAIGFDFFHPTMIAKVLERLRLRGSLWAFGVACPIRYFG